MSRGDALPLIAIKPDASLFDIVEDCERRMITAMLERCGWNQTEAAERFHVPLSTLNQKIKAAEHRDQAARTKRLEAVS